MNQTLYYSSEVIQERVKAIAAGIDKYYKHKGFQEIVVIGVMNGSFMFMADLVREMQGIIYIDFVKVSSYKNSTISNKAPRIQIGVSLPIKGKAVLIVDDIIDTGRSLQAVIKHVRRKRPACIKVCTFLNKPSRREVEVDINWVGFAVPNKFVIGYGMDYAGKFRDLDHIRLLLRFIEEAPMKVEPKSKQPFVAGRMYL